MTSKSTLTYLALGGLLLLPAIGMAGRVPQNDTPDKGAKVRKITGCLAKGESSNEYQLNASNGATWEVKSDAVDFASHVGHTVTLTGTVNNAMAHGAKEKVKDKAMDNPNEHGHMTVTNIKMISESCK